MANKNWDLTGSMKALAIALFLLSLSCYLRAQNPLVLHGSDTLASGEKISYTGYVSYNKLRRGTEMEITYYLFIHPEACFLQADNAAGKSRGAKLELDGTPGLITVVKQIKYEGPVKINQQEVPHCHVSIRFKIAVKAPPDQTLGMQKVSGQITWQGQNAAGVMEPQTNKFEIPIEIVEHGDRTAKYNEAYGYRPKPDLIWRIPSFPFVMAYCAVAGGPDCPD